MQVAVLLLLALLPTAFWLWLFVRRDLHPEPPWLLARTFAYGMIAWVLAAALELPLSALPGAAVLVAVAVFEEGAKLLAASTAARERDFDEPMDGLIYAVTAALGFSLIENFAYGLRFGTGVAVWHGLITTLAHALFSVPLGYALAYSRFGGGPWWLLLGLAASVALHVTFNGLLMGGGWVQLVALALVLLGMSALAGNLYGRLGARQRLK